MMDQRSPSFQFKETSFHCPVARQSHKSGFISLRFFFLSTYIQQGDATLEERRWVSLDEMALFKEFHMRDVEIMPADSKNVGMG